MKRIIILIVSLVVLGGAIGYWYLKKYLKSEDFSQSLRERLTALVYEKSNGRYSLQIGDIFLNADKKSASVRDIKLIPDSTLISEGMLYRVELANLLLKQVDIAALLANQSVNLGNITVAGGRLELVNLGKDSAAATAGKKPGIKEGKHRLFNSLKKSPLTGVQIDSLQLDQVELVYRNRKKKTQTIRNIHIDFIGLAVDSASMTDTTRVLFSKAVRVAIDSIDIPVSKDKYRLKAGRLLLSMGDKNMAFVKDLELRSFPVQSMEAAAAAAGVQKDIYHMKVKEITADGFDYTALLEDSNIVARSVLMSEPALSVFNDKSNPPATDSKVGKYPHQLIRKLPYKTDIPAIVVEKGSVVYEEKNEKGDGVGKIVFSRVTGRLGPLRDDGMAPQPLKATFTAYFMDKAKTDVQFNFPVSNNGQFTVDARFAPFDARILNAAALPLGSTRIASGNINRLHFTVKGNNTSARAYTTLNYQHLKIEVVKGDQSAGYRKRGLLTAIANNFVLTDTNLPGDRHNDQTSASYRRVVTKSFFNLVWKSVFYSVKENVGVGLMGKDKERAVIHK